MQTNRTKRALVALVIALVAAAPAQAQTTREHALSVKVAKLTAQLRTERATSAGLRTQLASKASDLATCQQGAMLAVQTMDAQALVTILVPALDEAFQRVKLADAARSDDAPRQPYTLATSGYDHPYSASYSATGELQTMWISFRVYGPAVYS